MYVTVLLAARLPALQYTAQLDVMQRNSNLGICKVGTPQQVAATTSPQLQCVLVTCSMRKLSCIRMSCLVLHLHLEIFVADLLASLALNASQPSCKR